MKITLERFAYLPEGTLGRILELDLFTLERPWLENQRNVSCIPEGEYEIKTDEEGRYQGFPELQDVPDRSEIIIHAANHVHEIQGCIAPGMRYTIDDKPHVWNSGDALKEVMAAGVTSIEITHIRTEY